MPPRPIRTAALRRAGERTGVGARPRRGGSVEIALPGTARFPPPSRFLRRCRFFVFRTPTILNFRIAFWPLEPWTRNDKRELSPGVRFPRFPLAEVVHRRPFFRRHVVVLLRGWDLAAPRGRRRPSGAQESQFFLGGITIKIKIHSSCEIEYFVETHLCKLCVILRSRVLRVVCPH